MKSDDTHTDMSIILLTFKYALRFSRANEETMRADALTDARKAEIYVLSENLSKNGQQQKTVWNCVACGTKGSVSRKNKIKFCITCSGKFSPVTLKKNEVSSTIFD